MKTNRISKKVISLAIGLAIVASVFSLSNSYAATNDWSNHWANENIQEFMEKGYVGVYSDGTFRPNSSITRGEFVKVFNKVFGLTNKSGKVFSDTKTHWAKDEIDIAVSNGVCNGKSATEFKPNDPITREEAAVMIANYKKIADSYLDKLMGYADGERVSSWARSSVEGVIEKGYMGVGSGELKYNAKITRAETVVTLSRVISLGPALPEPVSIKATTSSNSTSANANVSWEAVEGANGYDLYRATSGAGPYTKISTTTQPSYNDTGLTINKNYYYKVKAYTTTETGKGYSNFSSIQSIPTPKNPNALFRKKGGSYMNVIVSENPGWIQPLDGSASDVEIYMKDSQIWITYYNMGVTSVFNSSIELDVKVQSTGEILFHKDRTNS